MSGAKVAVPTAVATGSLAVPLLIGAAALAAASLVSTLREQARAREAQETERRRRAIQAERKRRREELDQVIGVTREAAHRFELIFDAADRLEAASLGERRKEIGSRRSRVPGFTDLPPPGGRGAEESRPILDRIMAVLEELPESAKRDAEWPFERLSRQCARYAESLAAGRPPSPSELHAFLQTVSLTLGRYRKIAESRLQAYEEFSQEIERLLTEVQVYHRLAISEEHREALSEMRQRLMRVATDGRASLDLEARQFAQIRAGIDREYEWRAYRRTLADALTRHMEDMGYPFREPFEHPESEAGGEAVMTVPGGGRLTAGILADGRMDFRLALERPDSLAPLSYEETVRYRRMEDRWSSDFRELIRRLTRDGFSYQVQLEDFAAIDSIPIVVVETAEEIASGEEEGLLEDVERSGRSRSRSWS